jgi:hypothetical protein
MTTWPGLCAGTLRGHATAAPMLVSDTNRRMSPCTGGFSRFGPARTAGLRRPLVLYFPETEERLPTDGSADPRKRRLSCNPARAGVEVVAHLAAARYEQQSGGPLTAAESK